MLTNSFPSLRPAPAPVKVLELGKNTSTYPHTRYPTSHDRVRASQLGITPEEVVRRDEIVRKQWLACDYKVGDVLVPVRVENRELYGKCHVEGIYKSYHDFHLNEEWPINDLPHILVIRPEKGAEGGRIICTPSYVMRPMNAGKC